MLTPHETYQALLIVQMLHLAHHRLAKRHISFVEVVTGAVLCVPPTIASPSALLMVRACRIDHHPGDRKYLD
jgi:hypothetical protein